MTKIPKSTSDAIITTATALLVPLGIPQAEVEAGVQSLLDRVCGRSTRNFTDKRPIDRMLTMKDAAELLHRSTKTIRSLVAKGKLKAVYCGDGQRASGVTESSVRRFLGEEAA